MINEAFFSLNLLSYIIKTTHYTLAVLVQTHLSDDFFFWPITAACLLVTKTQRGKAESSMFMFSLVLYQFCSHLIGAEIASNAASAQLSVKQRAWLKENGPGWPCSLGNGLWARRGVPIETSLPSQTSSFALGCACCQKRGRQCALGTVGSPGVHIHLGSFLLASAPLTRALCTPDLRPNTSQFPLTGYRCVYATHCLSFLLPLVLPLLLLRHSHAVYSQSVYTDADT